MYGDETTDIIELPNHIPNHRRHTFAATAVTEITNDMIADNKFRKRMRKKGFKIIDINADGNCLFRAVAHQIYYDVEKHIELRRQCVKHLKNHYDRFKVFCCTDFNSYLDDIALPGVWGDDVEIKALEEILDRIIIIYSSEYDDEELYPLNINFDEELLLQDISPIILSYHGNNHFNSVYKKDIKLPLGLRQSNIILNSRIKSFYESNNKKSLTEISVSQQM